MDIYFYSHHLFAWNCVDIVRRNYVLVTNEVVWFGWKYTPSMQFPAWGFSNTISMILFPTSPASDGADSCMARLVRRSFHGTENVENTISQLKREIGKEKCMKCLYFTNFQDSNTADIPLSCPKVLYVSNMVPVKVRLFKGCSNQDAILEGCLMNMVQVCRRCLVYKEGTHPQSASDLLDTSSFRSLIYVENNTHVFTTLWFIDKKPFHIPLYVAKRSWITI